MRIFSTPCYRKGVTRGSRMDVVNQALELFYSDKCCWFRTAAAVLGALYALRVILRFLWGLGGGLCAYVLAPLGISRINLKKYGPWAVVTGASEGIGRGYALELARRGLNVVIMSRSQQKLEKVADEIKEKYGREVRVIAVDFTDGQDVYPRIAEELADLDIGILVNNVGLSYEHPDFLCNVPEWRLRGVTELNCQALVQMTRLLLPKMVDKKRGIVVNVSSSSGVFPVPLLSVYSASKVFVRFFSDALRKEYQNKGILVQTVTPYFVATSMSGISRSSFTAPSPVAYTRSAVATIGIQNDTYGCIPHAIQGYVVSLLPDWVILRVSFNMMLGIRAKFLRRKARQSKEK